MSAQPAPLDLQAIAPPDPGSGIRESMAIAKPLLTDDLWVVIEPLLPKRTSSLKGGHPRLDDRNVLTGIPWEVTVQRPRVTIV
jgi:hypothetical protein